MVLYVIEYEIGIYRFPAKSYDCTNLVNLRISCFVQTELKYIKINQKLDGS